MKKLKLIIITIFFITFVNGTKAEKGEYNNNNFPNLLKSIKTTNLKTYTFALTHLNGRELEKTAYFYVGENPFKLDLKDGKKPFKYYISGNLGGMCGLYGKDGFGKSVSICITKLSNSTTEIEIKYTNKTLLFTGFLVN
jgi:hypothetical protein